MLARQVANDVLLTYGTLLMQRRLDAMLPHNQALADYGLKLRAAEPGASRSNAGGWHSDGNIFTRDEPPIAMLAQHLQLALRDMSVIAKQMAGAQVAFEATLFGWINVNGYGDYNKPHHHPGDTWSGVYYIRAGEAAQDRPTSGQIEFVDPRTRCEVGPNIGLTHAGTLRVAPADGMLLIFPSYLEHYVHPYFGPGERITLAFNSLVQTLNPLP